MFDPTIYENIKVVLEGAVYDMDLSGPLLITNRSDVIELSTMSRSYLIQFQEKELTSEDAVKAEIRIHAHVEDLAAEILENKEYTPGCYLEVAFITRIRNVEQECKVIEELLLKIWENRPAIRQKLSFEYHERKSFYLDEILLRFNRKIDENQIDDIKPLIQLTYQSLQRLNEYLM